MRRSASGPPRSIVRFSRILCDALFRWPMSKGQRGGLTLSGSATPNAPDPALGARRTLLCSFGIASSACAETLTLRCIGPDSLLCHYPRHRDSKRDHAVRRLGRYNHSVPRNNYAAGQTIDVQRFRSFHQQVGGLLCGSGDGACPATGRPIVRHWSREKVPSRRQKF